MAEEKNTTAEDTTYLYFGKRIIDAFEEKTKGMSLFRVITKERGLKFRSEPVTREYIHAAILKDEFWINRFTNIWSMEGLNAEGDWAEF